MYYKTTWPKWIGWMKWVCTGQWGPEVQFSYSVVSDDSLRPHGLQHASLSWPSTSPRACSNLCPLNKWCHWTISSSVVPFSSCLQSLPASGFFQMSQFFESGGQSIRASASATVFPMNIQGYDGLVWSPCSLRDSQESYPAPQFKSINSLAFNFLYERTLKSVRDYQKIKP